MSGNLYLERYGYPPQLKGAAPAANLNMVVTLPCHNEPQITRSLDALSHCDPPKGGVEIIVVINHSPEASASVVEQNRLSYAQGREWVQNNPEPYPVHLLYCDDLPSRHAGVGLARKIAMDEAVRRLNLAGNEKGIIACFDADATCDNNYLQVLERHFDANPETPGCSIYYEHDLSGDNAAAITRYEAGLRYYTNALRSTGFPYAFQTVGSSMAVRSWAYQKQGGMNRRKAGEDFYFLNRIMALGNFTNLASTTVHPSSRESDRVPFGTGRAMLDWNAGKKDLDLIYNPMAFQDLKVLFDQVLLEGGVNPQQWSPALSHYLKHESFEAELSRMVKHSRTPEAFLKHFFHWFDGFRVLKFIHFVRDHYYPQVKLTEAIAWLLSEPETDPKSGLLALREMDRN